jgi:hypothetical protein
MRARYLAPREPGNCSCLAAAYAEVGDFEAAVEWQKKALKLLDPNRLNLVLEYREMLELFEKSKPYRLPAQAPTLVASRDDYPLYVDKQIEVIGIVSETKCPQVQGIDAWDLADHRGQRVKLRGILREEVVTRADVEGLKRINVAHRGAGKFYRLDNMEFVVLPQP